MNKTRQRILIIDDEINILKALKRLLAINNYDIHTTINPLEALELLKTNNYDIIISDQRMPVMSGLNLLTHAKQISPKTKRVLISGFLDHKQPEDFVNYAEIVSYITKPWVDEELRLTIKSILKIKKLEEENEKLIEKIQKQNEELEAKNILLVGNIKNKKNQIAFVQKIIETSKIQLKTINRFLYIINSSTTIKETFSSLFSTIYNIIKFEEIGAVYSTPFEEKIKKDYQILNVMKNKRTVVRYMLKAPLNNIKNLLLKKSKIIVIQDFDRSKLYSQFSDSFITPDVKQVIIVPLFNRDKEKKQFIGFIFLGSKEKNFFQSSKLSLFTELLTILANTISEMIVFELIKDGGTQWEETFDAIQDPLILININFTILRANKAAIKLSRTYIKNLIGKKCFNLFANRESQCENCPLLSEEQIGRFTDTTGERYYNVKSFKIESNFLIYYKDYTETKQLYYKLVQSDKMAAIGELAGQIAHEINNPLAGLLAYSQLLLKEINSSSKFYKYTPDLLEIESAAIRCKEIVENLLSFSTSHKKYDFTDIDLNLVIEKTLPLAQYVLNINKITLKKEFSNISARATGNFNQLQQVVFNLITNACHAMTGGGVLTITTKKTKDGACMSIQDTGSGIPNSSLKKIFDPFYTTKEKKLGTGLGLYICHEIIRSHSGKIMVNSILDKGTSFTISIPRK